jgi:hypothetical protein
MRPHQRYLLPIQAKFLLKHRLSCVLPPPFSQSISALYLSMQRACQLKWPREIVRRMASLAFPSYISCATVAGRSVTPSCKGKLSHRPGVALAAAAN